MESPQRVCVKKAELKKRDIPSLIVWNEKEGHHYIGRNLVYYVPGAIGSPYRNPFSVERYGRDKALELYENHLRSSPELMERVDEILEWKEMGCWCLPTEACHGDILLRVAKEKRKQRLGE